jgi:hypothetical protein
MLDIFKLLIKNLQSLRENQVRVTRTSPFLRIGDYMDLNSNEIFVCHHVFGNNLGRRNFLNSSHYFVKAHSCIVYGKEHLITYITGV